MLHQAEVRPPPAASSSPATQIRLYDLHRDPYQWARYWSALCCL